MFENRSNLRRLAILGVLHEEGPCYANELETALRARPGSLDGELVFLEEAGLIFGRPDEGDLDRPGRIAYRAIPSGERAALSLLREIEDLAAGSGEAA